MSKISGIERKIIEFLRASPLSTYQIAKKLKVSWATARFYCYKLKALDLVEESVEKTKRGIGRKIVWKLKKK